MEGGRRGSEEVSINISNLLQYILFFVFFFLLMPTLIV